ncbi:MAG TPA: hypothetical protein VHX18_04465 [Rhizomicrobium sp.]|jgi:hypothetical protein|nr:hypothetical protein [Rhizomicrobium sp.]
MNSAARILEERLPDWKLCHRIDEAVAATSIGRTKVFEFIKTGKIQARRAEGMTVILREELQRYLNSLPPTKARIVSR